MDVSNTPEHPKWHETPCVSNWVELSACVRCPHSMLNVCIMSRNVILEFGIPLCAHKGVFLEKYYWGKSGLEYNIHLFKKQCLFSLIFLFSPTIYNSANSSKKSVFFQQKLKNFEIEIFLFLAILPMENKTHFLCKFKICLFACLFSLSRALCILIYHRRVTWMSSSFHFFLFSLSNKWWKGSI